jgi:hypothetical protein
METQVETTMRKIVHHRRAPGVPADATGPDAWTSLPQVVAAAMDDGALAVLADQAELLLGDGLPEGWQRERTLRELRRVRGELQGGAAADEADRRRLTVVPAGPRGVTVLIVPETVGLDLRVRIPVTATSTDAEIDQHVDRMLSRWQPDAVTAQARGALRRHRDQLKAMRNRLFMIPFTE